MATLITLILFLIVNLGLALVVGYYLGQSKLLDIKDGKLTGWMRNLAGAVIFGLLSIIGTLSAIDLGGTIFNNRDSGPVCAGLYFGPVIGIGAGLIGAVFRFFQGGITALPCTLGTFFAGCIAAVAGYYFRDKPSIWFAVLIGVIVVCVHCLLVIPLTTGGVEVGWHVIAETPAALAYGVTVLISIALFSWAFRQGSERGKAT